MSACYVEFTHSGGPSLTRLGECVTALGSQKGMPADEADRLWIQYFTDEQLSSFWWPSKEEEAATKATWGEVPVMRVSEQQQTRDWDIYSLFEVIRESEYRLLGVSSCEGARYRIEFEPDAHPFGGTASLQRLVQAFDGTVVAVDDGTGREEAIQQAVESSEPPEIRGLPPTDTPTVWRQFWR